MHDPACELPRIPLPRRSVNSVDRDEEEGRNYYAPALLLASVVGARSFLALLLPATQEVARGPAHRIGDPAYRIGDPAERPLGAGRQGVRVGIELLAQLSALVEQLLHPGYLSPRLLRFLALPRSQREELRGIFGAPYQHEGSCPGCVLQRPLDEGSPPLEELLLASRPNLLFARAVGLICPLHPSSSFSRGS